MLNQKYIILLTLIGASCLTGLAANANPGPASPGPHPGIPGHPGPDKFPNLLKTGKTNEENQTVHEGKKPSSKPQTSEKFTNVTIKLVSTTDKDLYDWPTATP